MSQLETRTFVGIGFGPIQTGVFLSEAQRCGRFDRLFVAEIDETIIEGLRANQGRFALNIAEDDAVRQESIGTVEVLDPRDPTGRESLVSAIASASELGTAIPSVRFYRGEDPGSPNRLIAAALEMRQGETPLIIYTAENNNHAAEELEAAVAEVSTPQIAGRARYLNTVIGKMSAVIEHPDEIAARGLEPLTPGIVKAHLVESFRRILISDPGANADRSIDAFECKTDLMPFEEAKLFGHNATHALAAYLGETVGSVTLSEMRNSNRAVSFLLDAFIDEAGAALLSKYGGIDPLFTRIGFRAYAEDLVTRMLNPHLGDLVERVGRDPERKLGWDDRLVGTMRRALDAGIEPKRFATGAAAALAKLRASRGDTSSDEAALLLLREIWGDEVDSRMAERIITLVREAAPTIAGLKRNGWSALG